MAQSDNSINVESVGQPSLAEHDSSVLDLAFAMDCTGSMGSYIAAAKDSIWNICEEIVASEKSDIKLSLVEYRDHPPQDKSFVTRTHDFVSSIGEMKKWLSQSAASGGGDAPEAVTDALHQLLKLNWREKSTKICIMISDAPPHGLGSHGDGFPGGCPDGLDPINITRELAQKGITLYTVGCGSLAVKCRDFFMTIAHITGGQFIPLANARLLAKVIIGSAQEQISLEKLQGKVDDVVKQATDNGKKEISDDILAGKIEEALGHATTAQCRWGGQNYQAPRHCQALSEVSSLAAYNSDYKTTDYDDLGDKLAVVDESYAVEKLSINQAQCKRMAKKSKFSLFKS
ncbi:unnamed protein product [Dimorphilus gyrociliatus]|uniref:VWFA domain-containing protein n=1 Tax=Dimorphilus gyrociliatus TaxID=2664684 RepID=A0A7I8VJ64_9ANNE|nr:unnamed protein product [Dimorphilus gyrociliatus]